MADKPPRTALIDPNKRRRGIYILPNLFTTAALFAGFYAIVQAMNDRFEHAAVAIFVAMILDGLDGRVARMTHTQSEFGAEYDSLSDMVSFGAAPALVSYSLIVMANLIVVEGAVAFLGLSVRPPTPTWGDMINKGRNDLDTAAHVSLVPAAVMFLTVLALNFVGDKRQERYEPRESVL